jgi:hypothetical protein
MEIEIIQRESKLTFGLSPKMSDFHDDILGRDDCYCVCLSGYINSFADKEIITS